MVGMVIESVVVAFIIGGILGAVTAVHLVNPKKQAVRAQSPHSQERTKR